jgi:hypothetical protein
MPAERANVGSGLVSGTLTSRSALRFGSLVMRTLTSYSSTAFPRLAGLARRKVLNYLTELPVEALPRKSMTTERCH